ncbi:zinc finger protein CONSTANS-LIKE 10-like [Carica papaya]|uniref:zinc finger protein CONSTANS-LIKE 10-like n=1 Tax=Carica papaya TaxID=3649 RepID=UPI000B8C794E|nr:zinc finger protein CONSTANS-LIKE 10-like [Carica papaya]
MRSCELCGRLARAYCESDEASLCWECDEKVHGANFLVARHSRILLCHVCQSLTPWNASGSKLARAISICENCTHEDDGVDGEATETENDDDEITTEDDSEQKEGEDGENQVVPSPATTTTPPAASSSSSD